MAIRRSKRGGKRSERGGTVGGFGGGGGEELEVREEAVGPLAAGE